MMSEDFKNETKDTWTADNCDYRNLKVSFEDVGESLEENLREGHERSRDQILNIAKL